MSDKKPAFDGTNSPDTHAKQGGGESGGGAYPNPHRGIEGDNAGSAPEDFTGHGGQTEIGYHGPGQLGGEKADKDKKGRVGQGG